MIGSVPRSRHALFIVPSAAALLLSAGVFVPQTAIRAVVVFPIALLLPGYAILLLVFGPNRRLDWAPALSLSALLSLAFYALAGLLLNAASIAFSTESVVVVVDVLVAGALTVGLLRSRQPQGSTIHDAWLPAEPPSPVEGERGINGKRMLALTALTGVLASAALAVALRLEPKPAPPPYAQLYLTGVWSHRSTPVAARSGATLHVTLGVTNRTHATQVYRVEPEVNERIAWSGRAVTLAPGATWTGSVDGRMPSGGGLHELIITVTREPQVTSVGSLTLWLQAVAPSSTKPAP